MDTPQTFLPPESQSVRSINDMISDTLSVNANVASNSQNEVMKTLKYDSVRMKPENSTLMTMIFPQPIPTMVLGLDSGLIAQKLLQLRVDKIECAWPHDLGAATTLASSDMLAVLWDNPEEDEAWRDL